MSIKKPFIIFVTFVFLCIMGLVIIHKTRGVNIVNDITLPARKIFLNADSSKAELKEYCFLSERDTC